MTIESLEWVGVRRCEALTKKGLPCTHHGVVRLFVGSRCFRHCPKPVQLKILERRAVLAAEDEAQANARADKIESRILDLHAWSAPFRRVPPPERIGWDLLRYVQSNACLICDCRGEHLTEDHDHQTGMVRALLCTSCNAREGHAGDRPWHVYRDKAPAIGWYVRYGGRNAQWLPSDPDPFPNRQKIEFDLKMLATDPLHELKKYLEIVDTLPPTQIPRTCERRFDHGVPLLLPGERYLRRGERRFFGRLDQWLIVDEGAETTDTQPLRADP